jgi:DNA-directed RNA polymerase beta subunit
MHVFSTAPARRRRLHGGANQAMALPQSRAVPHATADGAARHSFARITEIMPMPNLNNIQHDSFKWFLEEGVTEVFAEISPITRRRE